MYVRNLDTVKEYTFQYVLLANGTKFIIVNRRNKDENDYSNLHDLGRRFENLLKEYKIDDGIIPCAIIT